MIIMLVIIVWYYSQLLLIDYNHLACKLFIFTLCAEYVAIPPTGFYKRVMISPLHSASAQAHKCAKFWRKQGQIFANFL